VYHIVIYYCDVLLCMPTILKRCNKCDLFLPALSFSKNRNVCRRCRKNDPFKIIYDPALRTIVDDNKYCCACNHWKPLTEFSKNKCSGDGYHSECKQCASKRNSAIHKKRYVSDPEYRANIRKTATEWVKNNRVRSNEISHNWRVRNPYESKAVYRRHYWSHREARLALSKRLYYENIDVKHEYQHSYYDTNRRMLQRKSREYYLKFPEKRAAVTKHWLSRNPDKITHYSSSRRARERNAEGTFTIRQWNFLKTLFNHRCAYCGCKPKRLTKDHLIPLIKGGRHSIDNIVPSCVSCNSKKNSSTSMSWLLSPYIHLH